jgi:pectinesterase
MTLVARKPIKGKQNTINAHGWEHATKTTGFMFQFCNVVARDDLVHANFPVETYLGRLRKVQAHVVFMECDLQSLVDPRDGCSGRTRRRRRYVLWRVPQL